MLQKWFICCFLVFYLFCVISGIHVHAATPSSRSNPSQNSINRLLQAQKDPYAQIRKAHLLIPRININAPIEVVTDNADGSVAVPTIHPWTNVGWYLNGPFPGEIGSSIIDGHLDRPGGSPAVFWNLRQVRSGDQVFFDQPGQARLHFRVTHVGVYKPADAPLDDIFNNTHGHFLNLITCAGRWIPSIHQTTHRLVVFTVLV